MKLENKILRTGKVNYRDLEPFQPDDFKNTTPERMEKLKTSLKNNGVTAPFYVWEHKGKTYTLDGHHRLRAMAELESEGISINKVPAVFMDLANKKEAKKALLLYNSHYADIDTDSFMGFVSEFDLSEMDLEIDIPDIEVAVIPQEIEEDEPPPVPETPKSKWGDIYELGPHRVMCGDSSDKDSVLLLLNGMVPKLLLTDPPYDVEYDKSRDQRGGDAKVHGKYLESKLTANFLKWANCDVLVMTFPVDRHFTTLYSVLLDSGYELKKELVWVKSKFSFWPGAKYKQKHEPILICGKPGAAVYGEIPSNQSTVLEFPMPTAHKIHPTSRPLSLWSMLMGYHSFVGDLVYDSFGGSGTTIISAQELDRVAFTMEIIPGFVDVSVQRWVNYTGQTTIIKNGQKITWEE